MEQHNLDVRSPNPPHIKEGGLRCWLPSWQFARYLLVGLWNTAFGYLLYAALT